MLQYMQAVTGTCEKNFLFFNAMLKVSNLFNAYWPLLQSFPLFMWNKGVRK